MTDDDTPALGPRLPAIHLDVLYRLDARGRIEQVRSASVPTPLVHLVRSASGNSWAVRSDLPEDLAARLDALFREEPVVGPEEWEHRPPACLGAVRALLGGQHPGGREYRGPAFTFPDTLSDAGDAESYEPDGDESSFAERLAWAATASPDELPIAVRRDGGRIVSLCHSARRSEVAAEAGLETAAEARRQGHGATVTLRWALEARHLGLMPLYSTSWENEASRGVARRLGLLPYGEDWHWTPAAVRSEAERED